MADPRTIAEAIEEAKAHDIDLVEAVAYDQYETVDKAFQLMGLGR